MWHCTHCDRGGLSSVASAESVIREEAEDHIQGHTYDDYGTVYVGQATSYGQLSEPAVAWSSNVG
jgi:hypothetical protein